MLEDAFAECVLSRPVAAHKGVVDDGHGWSVRGVGGSEIATAQQRHAERPEEVVGDDVEFAERMFVRTGLITFDAFDTRRRRTSAEWCRKAQTGGLYTRQRTGAFEQAVVKILPRGSE